jgi:signal peptidase II
MQTPLQIINNKWIFYILSSLVVLTDQITKLMVIKFVPLFDSIPNDGIVRITHLTNTGSAFGLFQDMNAVLTVIGIIGVIFILYFYINYSGKPFFVMIGLSLIFGGAVGNLIDRIYRGAVVDFIDVKLWNDVHFPSFNVADSSLSVGGFILVALWIYRRYLHADQKNSARTDKSNE